MTYTIRMVRPRQFIEPGLGVSTYLDFGARLFSTQWPPYGAHILQGLLRNYFNPHSLCPPPPQWPLSTFSKHRPSGSMLSISQNVRRCVCLSVCSLLRYQLNIFLPPLPEIGCPKFVKIQNPWGNIMERSGLAFFFGKFRLSSRIFLYWCYYPHRLRDALSPVCRIYKKKKYNLSFYL